MAILMGSVIRSPFPAFTIYETLFWIELQSNRVISNPCSKMSSFYNILAFMFCLFSIILIPTVSGAACESPKYSANGYSTQDGFFHYSTTYIVEFALQCANNYKDASFYALVGDKTLQLAVSEETAKYQVSWQLEHSDSGAQTFDVHIYDEDKFAEHKKAEESGSSSVQPLFSVQHYHAGTSRKSWLSSESVFLLLGVAALYYALNLRQQLSKRD